MEPMAFNTLAGCFSINWGDYLYSINATLQRSSPTFPITLTIQAAKGSHPRMAAFVLYLDLIFRMLL